MEEPHVGTPVAAAATCPTLQLFAVLRKVKDTAKACRKQCQDASPQLPAPTPERLLRSQHEEPFDVSRFLPETNSSPDADPTNDTVLYLAYGSNLSAKTFKGDRKIKPLTQVNVLVPTLALSFSLPGIPYNEPCFANTVVRKPPNLPLPPYPPHRPTPPNPFPPPAVENTIPWSKGLVGVVYEVTREDYATIIATEGGGASYIDIVVPCFALPPHLRNTPDIPTTRPFLAHTLFSPPSANASRPNPSYAQPSSRYLSLITTGAAEHNLPLDYQRWLSSLSPYTITTDRQKIGSYLFLLLWSPLLIVFFVVTKLLADKNGKVPLWYAGWVGGLFKLVWMSYDKLFRNHFGDGERTMEPSKKQSYGEKETLLPRTEKRSISH